MKRNTQEHPAQPTDAKFKDAHAHVPRKQSRGLNKMLQHPAAKRASSTINSMIRHAAWMKQTFLGKQNNEHMTLAQKKTIHRRLLSILIPSIRNKPKGKSSLN